MKRTFWGKGLFSKDIVIDEFVELDEGVILFNPWFEDTVKMARNTSSKEKQIDIIKKYSDSYLIKGSEEIEFSEFEKYTYLAHFDHDYVSWINHQENYYKRYLINGRQVGLSKTLEVSSNNYSFVDLVNCFKYCIQKVDKEYSIEDEIKDIDELTFVIKKSSTSFYDNNVYDSLILFSDLDDYIKSNIHEQYWDSVLRDVVSFKFEM